MSRLAVFVTAVVACFALEAAAQTPPPLIRKPEWIARPSGEDMARHFPDRALRRELGGWAVLVCRVRDDGRLHYCRVGAEAPIDREFGTATLAVSRYFRMSAPTDNGSEQPIVVVPVTWALEGDAPPQSAAVGEPALIPSVAPADAPREGTFACATPADPARRCLAHHFYWTDRPAVTDIAPLIRSAGDKPSVMECLVAADGALSECKLSRGHSPETAAEILKLAPAFRASAQTRDGIDIAGHRALITFDWKTMRQVLDTIEAVRATN